MPLFLYGKPNKPFPDKYPRVDAHNPYLITRYAGTVINAQPWGAGSETCEVWDWSSVFESGPNTQGVDKGSDQIWKLLSKPLEGTKVGTTSDVIERRNPLALAHFANHPVKGMMPNFMVCPYDFLLTEKDMRIYVPNILFESGDGIKMKRFDSFWFKSGGFSNGGLDVPILKSLVLVDTRALCDEELCFGGAVDDEVIVPPFTLHAVVGGGLLGVAREGYRDGGPSAEVDHGCDGWKICLAVKEK
ncbi:hypothetical protein F0562_023952 [Nyssa sinensis]|uniref:Uncharacterized protein n=1 Tax=Nyssa sinensis TaxID=561372 RepID=A0A5J5BKM6_9ASTE|nr:hypothetical protein F0562_023952 [Nyssa sinensis]